MKKLLLFLCLMAAIIIISACSAEQEKMLKVSKSSDEFVGENYKTVISQLEETGFTNIKTKVLDDLITGWLTKDGEIEKVEINGDTEFSANDSFQKNSKIVITYHTFPSEEERATKSTDEKKKDIKSTDENKRDTQSTDEKKRETKSTDEKKKATKSTDEKSSKTVEQSTNDTSILTVKNNEDLAALLSVKNENDPIIGKFAKKYVGRIIEFDGNIANMMQHGNYKTRYNILILAGDYNETTFSGPNFQFENVGVIDLNLTGSEIPDSIGAGQNLHITAEVVEYNETSELFRLKPINTEIR
ncbi:DUF4839 domain-containing protein [Bacillus sp. DNRA2]|uniref:DUF4839 domain-containing protein n=1 Tax=Bacillus sp. DNRA2 TaxID=2723053 RepID=UPI00145CB998|nr:DUF4839 domain-containing protein [Bacillus sp. DNRA2]NMD71526.1 DUF4839 domain-containing protein [Bacillus sp. DNRA2]